MNINKVAFSLLVLEPLHKLLGFLAGDVEAIVLIGHDLLVPRTRNRIVVCSILCEFDELIGARALIVARLSGARRVSKFLCCHSGQLFLIEQALLDHGSLTKPLTHVSDFIIARSIDLEAELTGLIQVPVPQLHVVSASDGILGCLPVDLNSLHGVTGYQD